MAGTISITTVFNLAGENVCTREPTALEITQANVLMYDAVISNPTADTALAFGSISGSALGWLFVENMDPTNYLDIGPTSGGAIVPMVRIPPGKTAGPFLVVPSITLRAQANTAAVKARYTMYAN